MYRYLRTVQQLAPPPGTVQFESGPKLTNCQTKPFLSTIRNTLNTVCSKIIGRSLYVVHVRYLSWNIDKAILALEHTVHSTFLEFLHAIYRQGFANFFLDLLKNLPVKLYQQHTQIMF